METKPGRAKHRHLSPVRKHSLSLVGHKTAISLEDQFWDGLCAIARNEKTSVAMLVERIDADRAGNNLSSSIRLFVLEYFKTLSQISSPQATSDLTPSAPSPAR